MKKLICLFSFIAVLITSYMFTIDVTLATSLAFVPVLGMNFKRLQNFASQNFSSFLGENDFYTGQNDDFVDFGGENGNFLVTENRIFVMTIVNSVAYTRYAYIMPGLGWAPGKIASISQITDMSITVNYPNGIVRDGNFNDKNGSAGLCGSGSPKTIETFLSYIYANPIHCHQIKIQASANASQIAQQLTISSENPFFTDKSEVLNPDQHIDQNTYQDKKVVFPVDLILSKDLKIEYPITASETVTITFFCGATANSSVTLKKRVKKAKSTLAVAGTSPFKSISAPSSNMSIANPTSIV